MDYTICPNSHTSSTKTNEKDGQSVSQTPSQIKHTISLLPREKGVSALELYQYQGFWIDRRYIEGVVLSQEKFHAKPTDIFICSNIKSGKTWLKALCFAIYTREDYDDSSNPLLTTNPHECMPFIESDLTQIINRKGEDGSRGHPLVSTYIPFTLLPKSILCQGCKIIYICRDPKDAFISMWHYYNKLRKAGGIESIPIEEALDLFSKGLSNYGPFWDHVLGYWNAWLENPDKVLLLRYEDMMRDTGFYVKKLASFMGCPFSIEEKVEGMVEKILFMCSFGNLSNLEVNKNRKSDPLKMGNIAIENNVFFRKGEIGDWKSYLAEKDAAYLDAITEEKFQGSGLVLQQSK